LPAKQFIVELFIAAIMPGILTISVCRFRSGYDFGCVSYHYPLAPEFVFQLIKLLWTRAKMSRQQQFSWAG
jgi:hypothetical protein